MTVLPPTGEVPTAPSPVSTPLHSNTPFVHSAHLSNLTGHNIYLKLDCDQPSGSFKIRGIGKICQSAILRQKQAGSSTPPHLVTSSGGNAGLAVAYAASRAGVGSTIFVPTSTEADVVEKLRATGAEVVVGGDSWDQADQGARGLVREKEGAVYVHPFEGDELVSGHSGLVDELYDQFAGSAREGGENIDAIICSVGGGGLIRGIIQGALKQTQTPTLVAVQNFGVDSFNRSFDRHLHSSSSGSRNDRPGDVVTLDKIASKCTSMGTKKCSLTTLHDAIAYHNRTASQGGITTLTVTDDLSASACWQFSSTSDQIGDGKGTRMVELSCASALTPVFHPWILEELVQRSEALKAKVGGGKKLNIVIEVCGGSKVNAGLWRSIS